MIHTNTYIFYNLHIHTDEILFILKTFSTKIKHFLYIRTYVLTVLFVTIR